MRWTELRTIFIGVFEALGTQVNGPSKWCLLTIFGALWIRNKILWCLEQLVFVAVLRHQFLVRIHSIQDVTASARLAMRLHVLHGIRMQAQAKLVRLIRLDQFLLVHLLYVEGQPLVVQGGSGLTRAQLVLQVVFIHITNDFRLLIF